MYAQRWRAFEENRTVMAERTESRGGVGGRGRAVYRAEQVASNRAGSAHRRRRHGKVSEASERAKPLVPRD